MALEGMQPTLRQTPPRNSRSITQVLNPSWDARMAATYPPGPAPITQTSKFCFIYTSNHFEHKLCRAFNPFNECFQKVRGHRAVDQAVIASRREVHGRLRNKLFAIPNGFGFKFVHSDNRNFGMIDNRGCVGSANAADIGDRNRR